MTTTSMMIARPTLTPWQQVGYVDDGAEHWRSETENEMGLGSCDKSRADQLKQCCFNSNSGKTKSLWPASDSWPIQPSNSWNVQIRPESQPVYSVPFPADCKCNLGLGPELHWACMLYNLHSSSSFFFLFLIIAFYYKSIHDLGSPLNDSLKEIFNVFFFLLGNEKQLAHVVARNHKLVLMYSSSVNGVDWWVSRYWLSPGKAWTLFYINLLLKDLTGQLQESRRTYRRGNH